MPFKAVIFINIMLPSNLLYKFFRKIKLIIIPRGKQQFFKYNQLVIVQPFLICNGLQFNSLQTIKIWIKY